MKTSIQLKAGVLGVLGVLGVPKTLEAKNHAVCSQGTPLRKLRNTKAPEHPRCSMNEAARPVRPSTPAQAISPSCRPLFRCAHALNHGPARLCLRQPGRGDRQIANGALL